MRDQEPLGARDAAWGGLLACAAAVLYLCFLTKGYVFEGLARAMPIEVGRFGELFSGNYLLYGLLGWGFHGLIKAAGGTNLAVVSLQIMDALIGACGLFLHFLTLRRLGASRPAAAVWSAVLGFCLGYWGWSTDAQNYILSTALLEANFLLLLSHASGARIPPEALGACHALAVLGHIVNLLFGLVGVFFLVWTRGRSWRKPVLRYALASSACVLAAYSAVLLLIVKPAGPAEAFRWFLGSAATPEGRMVWHGRLQSLQGLGQWAKMTLNVVVSAGPPFGDPPAWRGSPALRWLARALLALFSAAFALRARRLEGLRRGAALACGMWLLAYAAVFTSWEPYTMVYRVSDLVPMTILLFLGACGARPARVWGAAGALFAAALFAANFSAEIYPRSFAANNPNLSRMAFVKAHTAEGDWVAGDGGAEELYIPYFAERRPLVLGQYRRPGELERRVDALLAAGRPVYMTSIVLDSPLWGPRLRPYRLEPSARDAGGFALFRVWKAR